MKGTRMSPAPTTSEWSKIVLPTKVRLIVDTWRYLLIPQMKTFISHHSPHRQDKSCIIGENNMFVDKGWVVKICY